MNETELFNISEAIDRGESCPICGAEWKDAEAHSKEMTHAEDCEFHTHMMTLPD